MGIDYDIPDNANLTSSSKRCIPQGIPVSAPSPQIDTRLAQLRSKLKELKLDAIIISSPENRRYLSGFTGTAGFLLISCEQQTLATDFRYVEQAEQQAPNFAIERITSKLDWMPKLALKMGVSNIGFEADDLTVAQYNRIRSIFSEIVDRGTASKLISTTGLVSGLRAIKDAVEQAFIQKAIDIADNVMDEISVDLKPGVTEETVALRIETAMRQQGAESPSFPTIVGSGPNASRPHHRAGKREIREGETIIIDMGAKYQGYCSDLTRTFYLGKHSDKFKRVYDIVLGAQLTAIETISTGMTGSEADKLARLVINEAGYGDKFGHSLGHGVGLEVHESPGVGMNAVMKLEDGMIFTVEPGIYISGWGGVRIEDIVMLQAGRARVLSRSRKVVDL